MQLAAALALVAAWPLALAGWLIGRLTERATRAAGLREAVWGFALALPVIVLVEAVAWPVLRTGAYTSNLSAVATKSAPIGALLAPAAPSAVMDFLTSPQAAWIAALIVAVSLAGLAWRTVRFGWSLRRLAALALRAEALEEPGFSELERPAQALGLPVRPVRVSAEIVQPLLVGIRHPVVLLPQAMAGSDPQGRSLVVAHELAHARRADNLRLALVEAVLGLFWLTPPMAAIARRLLAAGEERCDALALAGSDDGARRAYARTLTDTLRLGAGLEPSIAFIGAGRSPNLMRVNAILQPARPAGRLAAVLLAGVGVAVAAAASVAAQEAGKTAADAAAVTAPDQRGVTITADRVRASKDKVAYEGRVELKLDAPRPDAAHMKTRRPVVYLIDGKPAPAGFNPESIKPDQIERLDSDNAKSDGPTTINFVLKKG